MQVMNSCDETQIEIMASGDLFILQERPDGDSQLVVIPRDRIVAFLKLIKAERSAAKSGVQSSGC